MSGDENRIRTAHHEGGHAGVYSLLGVELLRVTIAPSRGAGRCYVVEPVDFLESLAGTLAGPMAEAFYARGRYSSFSIVDSAGWRNDRADIVRLYEQRFGYCPDLASDPDYRQALGAAHRIVAEYWQCIAAVADALLQRGTLSGREVNGIIRRITQAA